MWPSMGNFLIDITKKLLVSIIVTLIFVICALFYTEPIKAAVYFFSPSWYVNYWYILLCSILFAVLEGFCAVNWPSRIYIAVLIGFTFVCAVIFSIYELGSFILQSISVVYYFALFCFILSQILLFGILTLWWLVQKIIISIPPSRSSPDSAAGPRPCP